MAITAKLLFKNHIGFRLENELCTTRGFHVLYRLNGGGLCLQKGHSTVEEELLSQNDENEAVGDIKGYNLPWSPDPSEKEPEDWWDVPKSRVTTLEKWCEDVYNQFPDPYRQTQEIRDEIEQMTMRRRLNKAEAEVCTNWAYCNVL